MSLLNIDYIAHKHIKNVKDFLGLVNSIFEVTSGTNEMFGDASAIENDDLEDNLQYASAKRSPCDLIVTNDNKFYAGKITKLTSSEFV